MRREDGIGLLEIIMAMGLMALLTVISLPQLQSYQSSRDLRHVARLIGGDIRLVQQYAITKDENYRLDYVTTPASSYTIVKVSDSSVLKEVQLPASVTVTSTFTSNRVEFASTGAPVQDGKFCLAQSSMLMKVEVKLATGHTEITEVTTCP